MNRVKLHDYVTESFIWLNSPESWKYWHTFYVGCYDVCNTKTAKCILMHLPRLPVSRCDVILETNASYHALVGISQYWYRFNALPPPKLLSTILSKTPNP